MIQHTVIFRLNRPVDEGTRTGFLSALHEFAASAPFAAAPPQVLTDLGLRPEGRSVSEGQMVAQFASVDDFRSYLADPLHIALVNDVLVPNCESWLSVQADI